MSRLFEIAAGVAPLLDGLFRYNTLAEERTQTHWRDRAVLNDDTKPGRQVILKTCWDKPSRVEITGRLCSSYAKTRITVAAARDVPAIAADINRRFLPSYLAEWDAAQAHAAERTAKLDLYRHQVDLLKRFLPGFRQLHGARLTGSDEFYFNGGSVRLSSSGYDADLRLSVPFSDLVRVLVFLYQQETPD